MGSRDTAAIQPAAKVTLIPWDPSSDAHYQRLYDQRLACTWDYDSVSAWRETVAQGTKLMYWIVLSDDLPRRDELMQKHFDKYEKERSPLLDTAAKIGKAAREPTNVSFFPIGHIGMEYYPDRNEEFSLPPTTYWVKSLYISWALQDAGLGRCAMRQLERAASLPPFNCTVIALDTVTAEYELREESLRAWYDAKGKPRPDVIRTNQGWYERQGYVEIGQKEHGYDYTVLETGKIEVVPTVFLKKELA